MTVFICRKMVTDKSFDKAFNNKSVKHGNNKNNGI